MTGKGRKRIRIGRLEFNSGAVKELTNQELKEVQGGTIFHCLALGLCPEDDQQAITDLGARRFPRKRLLAGAP